DGAVAEKRVVVADPGFTERAAKQLRTEPRRVHVQVGGEPATVPGDQRGDPLRAGFSGHGRIDDLHARLDAPPLEPTDQLAVLDVERVVVVKAGQTVRPPGEDLVMRHEGGC